MSHQRLFVTAYEDRFRNSYFSCIVISDRVILCCLWTTIEILVGIIIYMYLPISYGDSALNMIVFPSGRGKRPRNGQNSCMFIHTDIHTLSLINVENYKLNYANRHVLEISRLGKSATIDWEARKHVHVREEETLNGLWMSGGFKVSYKRWNIVIIV